MRPCGTGRPLPWRWLTPSPLLLGAGVALVNHAELDRMRSSADADLARHAWGGLLGSWPGTLRWNAASQRLPTTLAGQLIVFETLAALSYAWVLRGQGPDTPALAGVALLVAGVVWALRR